MTVSQGSGIYRNHVKYLAFVLIPFLLSFFPPAIVTTSASDKPFPFHPGEKLTYRAMWGFIPAGQLTLEVLPIETTDNITAYHFAMIMKTSPTIDHIYKVRERQDSYCDIGMTHSILYKKVAEGEHPRDVIVNFYWDKLEATRSNFGEKMAPVHIVPGTFDTVSLYYVIRLKDITENNVIEIPISEGDNNVMVKVRVAKREMIEIDEKVYETFEVIPDMEKLEAQHVVKKGDVPELKIWFTADDKKIPVKIQSKVKVGYFIFELIAIEPRNNITGM
ncbi:MAG: DUF3108 domain-containing protein [Syntrophales bacterium]